jgi:hypothetical protein
MKKPGVLASGYGTGGNVAIPASHLKYIGLQEISQAFFAGEWLGFEECQPF